MLILAHILVESTTALQVRTLVQHADPGLSLSELHLRTGRLGLLEFGVGQWKKRVGFQDLQTSWTGMGNQTETSFCILDMPELGETVLVLNFDEESNNYNTFDVTSELNDFGPTFWGCPSQITCLGNHRKLFRCGFPLNGFIMATSTSLLVQPVFSCWLSCWKTLFWVSFPDAPWCRLDMHHLQEAARHLVVLKKAKLVSWRKNCTFFFSPDHFWWSKR